MWTVSAMEGALSQLMIAKAEFEALQARQKEQQCRAEAFFGYGNHPMHCTFKPCPRCGRTRQNVAHKTCDGCGFPILLERLEQIVPSFHVW